MKKSLFLALFVSAAFNVFSQSVPPIIIDTGDPHPDTTHLHVGTHPQLIIKNCYQQFTANDNTTYNILGGQLTNFNNLSPGLYSSVDLYHVDPVTHVTNYYVTVPVDYYSIMLYAGNTYDVIPNAGSAFMLNVLDPTIIRDNGSTCFTFGQPITYRLSAFLAGLCVPPAFHTSSDDPNVFINENADEGTVTVGDPEFCSQSDPQISLCKPVTVDLTIFPCNAGDAQCPPYTLSQNVMYCCNCPEDPHLLPRLAAPQTAIGINALTKETTVSMYPNPANSQVAIRTSDGGTIVIRNVLGETVRTMVLEANTEITVTGLAAGNYICNFNANGKKPVTKKLVIIN